MTQGVRDWVQAIKSFTSIDKKAGLALSPRGGQIVATIITMF